MKLWNKIIIIFILLLVLFVVLGILYYNGYLDNTNWKILTMIGAAAAGPYILVRNWLRDKIFSSGIDKVKESEEIYLKLRKAERLKRSNLSKIISDKDKQIESLKQEVNILNIDLKSLQEQRASVKADVEELTTDELLAEFDEEF